MMPLCVPLLVSSVRKTNSAAIAAEVRGFDLRTRESGFKEYPFAGIDFAALAVAVADAAAAIGAWRAAVAPTRQARQGYGGGRYSSASFAGFSSSPRIER